MFELCLDETQGISRLIPGIGENNHRVGTLWGQPDFPPHATSRARLGTQRVLRVLAFRKMVAFSWAFVSHGANCGHPHQSPCMATRMTGIGPVVGDRPIAIHSCHTTGPNRLNINPHGINTHYNTLPRTMPTDWITGGQV